MYKIALDAGHGLYTPGRRCLKQYDPAETREWQLNSRVAQKVEQLLHQYQDVQTKRMDDTIGAVDVPLAARVSAANTWDADLYISIHHNAGGGTGIVSFCYGAGSSASFSFRDLVYKHLIRTTGNCGNRAEPLATANFYVIKNTAMPAVLLELGFMDHPADIQQIITDDYADKCAKGIVAAIADFAGLQSDPAIKNPSGWVQDATGWHYYQSTGQMVRNAWHQNIDGNWYWFDGAGRMVTDTWYQYHGHWYYLGADGAMVKGLQVVDGKWYYMDDAGQMATEPVTLTPGDDGALRFPGLII